MFYDQKSQTLNTVFEDNVCPHCSRQWKEDESTPPVVSFPKEELKELSELIYGYDLFKTEVEYLLYLVILAECIVGGR